VDGHDRDRDHDRDHVCWMKQYHRLPLQMIPGVKECIHDHDHVNALCHLHGYGYWNFWEYFLRMQQEILLRSGYKTGFSFFEEY
jgi:hypothetical protein